MLLDSCKTLDCIVLWRKDTQLYQLINSILLADVYQILFILPYISININYKFFYHKSDGNIEYPNSRIVTLIRIT